jgi:hypothetical protein
MCSGCLRKENKEKFDVILLKYLERLIGKLTFLKLDNEISCLPPPKLEFLTYPTGTI